MPHTGRIPAEDQTIPSHIIAEHGPALAMLDEDDILADDLIPFR